MNNNYRELRRETGGGRPPSRLPPSPILKPLFHHNANPLALTFMLTILIFYHFFVLFLLNSTDYTAILQVTYVGVIS